MDDEMYNEQLLQPIGWQQGYPHMNIVQNQCKLAMAMNEGHSVPHQRFDFPSLG